MHGSLGSKVGTLGLLLTLAGAGACNSTAGSSSTAGATGGLDTGTAGTSGGAPTCGANEVVCDGGCSDPQTDAQNCGGCGMVCAKGQVCAASSCVATCAGANGTICGGDCVDLSTDQANCGSCGHGCSAGQSCTSGTCQATACTPPNTSCGSGEIQTCTSLQTDPENCGACGHACATGIQCVGGSCQACSGSQISCAGVCTDTQTDGSNCGACGHSCGVGLACAGGSCQACTAGETSCGGSCTDTQTDGLNCGGCADAGGHVCTSAQACQSGACDDVCDAGAGLSACGSAGGLACVDLGTDPANCGSCGHGCGDGLGCDGGSCDCPLGQSLCGAVCFDTSSDPLNCGACGHACSSQLCHLGNCLFCAAGSFGFGPLVPYDAGSAPGYVGIADFNGDGRPDLAASNTNDGTLGVLSGVDGGFAPQVAVSSGLDTAILAIGDLNGDGRPDVATLDSSADSFSLLLDQAKDGGALSFTLEGPFVCQAAVVPQTLVILDVNGDGLPDVVVGGGGFSIFPPAQVGTLDVFLQSDAGFPSQSSSSVNVGQSVQALATVRQGSDGGLALAAADFVGNAVLVLGPGLLAAPSSYAVGNGPVSLAAADLNGDGIEDLAVLNQVDGTVTVLTGKVGGTFTVGSPIEVVASSGIGGVSLVAQWVTIGDVNGDGVPDLIVSVEDGFSLGGDVVSYLINQGNATFAAPVSVPVAASGFSPYSVALRDLNGDGLPDLALGNFGSGDFVGVLYGQCP